MELIVFLNWLNCENHENSKFWAWNKIEYLWILELNFKNSKFGAWKIWNFTVEF